MVVLNKIYTKTGDDGTTALGTGERRLKYDLRVEAYGTVDEANACIGLARLHTSGDADLDRMLSRIQNDMFDLGADLATPDTGEKLDYEPLRVTEGQVNRIEADIDALNAGLQPLRSFVGQPASGTDGCPPCRAHDCRTGRETRRACERRRDPVHEPCVRFPVRCSAGGQRQWRA